MFPFSVARYKPEGKAKAAEGGGIAARAPKLKDYSERAVISIVKGLQTMAGPATRIEGRLAGMAFARVKDVIAAHRADAVIGSILVKDLSCMTLVRLDGTLVHAIVELLCGGDGHEPQPAEPRPATQIDQQFAQIIFTLAASAVQTEWADLGFTSSRAARIEGLLTEDLFGARVEEVGVVDMTIGIFGLHGTLQLVLPPVALERFDGEARLDGRDASDPLWSVQLHDQLGRTPVPLSAYIDAKDLPLSVLAGLKIGQILPLAPDARSRTSLVSDGTILFRGEIGRDEDNYSLRIDELVSEPSKTARLTAARRVPVFPVIKG